MSTVKKQQNKKKSDWISLREGNDANMDKCLGIEGLEGSNDIFIALVYFSITRHFYVKKKLIDKKRERVDKTVNRFLGYTVEKDIQIVFIQQLTD